MRNWLQGETLLKTLTYFSSATVRFTDEDLVALLQQSRERSAADGITGMMIYHAGNFVQALEGPEDSLTATFARISADPRHSDIVIALEDTIDERAFPDWTMGFRDLADGSAEEIEGFSTFFNETRSGVKVPARMPPHYMLRAFSRPDSSFR